MTEKGFVEKTEKGMAYVAVISDGCGGCKASCIGCGKKRVVKALSMDELKSGDKAQVVTSDKALYILMLAFLLVPLVLLIISYLLLSPLFSSPFIPACISLAVCAAYILIFAVASKFTKSFLPKAYLYDGES